MQNQDVDSQCSTLVVVENEIFGTRGSFRTELTPRRVAEFALFFIEVDFIEAGEVHFIEAGTVKASSFPRPNAEYCDCGSAAVAIVLGPNRVLLRYHAVGDLTEAPLVSEERSSSGRWRDGPARSRDREDRAMRLTMDETVQSGPSPYDFHFRPKDFTGSCPICGFPEAAKNRQRQHRAVAEDEGLDAIWIERIKGPHGYRNVAFGSRRPVTKALPAPVPKPPKKVDVGSPRGPSQKTIVILGKAAAMLAAGRTVAAACKELKIDLSDFSELRRKHSGLLAKG